MTKDEAWDMIDSSLDHCYSEKDVLEIKEALAQQDAEAHLQAVADFGQLQAQPDERDRCTHGVWAADHCYKCALAQPAQEPVARLAWVQDFGSMLHLLDAGRKLQEGNHYLYTSPPQREWVGLTGEELADLYNQKTWDVNYSWEYERALEAKLKEKNA